MRILILTLAFLAGCKGGGSDTDSMGGAGGDDSENTGGDDSQATGDDSSGGGDDTSDPGDALMAVAVGFTIRGVVLPDDEVLGNWYYPDSTDYYPPYVVLTLADADYFSAESEEDQLGHYCSIVGTYDTSDGYSSWDNDDGVELWAQWESTFVLDNTDCTNLDPAYFPDDPTGELTFDGMRLGMGVGPMTDYLKEGWSEENLKNYGKNMAAMYTAINHPDGKGGVTFIGQDWGTALFAEWDPETEEIVLADDGTSFNLINVQNLGEGADPPEAFMYNIPYWYEDFPLLDLSLLKEGI